MSPRFKALYKGVKKRVDYWCWNRLSKYSMVKGCKSPGVLFIAMRTDKSVMVVEVNEKANHYTANGKVVSFDAVCLLIEHTNKEIERYNNRIREARKALVKKPLVLDDKEFHRQKDLETKASLINHNSTNTRNE